MFIDNLPRRYHWSYPSVGANSMELILSNNSQENPWCGTQSDQKYHARAWSIPTFLIKKDKGTDKKDQKGTKPT